MRAVVASSHLLFLELPRTLRVETPDKSRRIQTPAALRILTFSGGVEAHL